jgi:hypothetical protein
MPKKPDVGAELYEFLTGEGLGWTVGEVAKKFHLRAPLVTHYVVEHCVGRGLPLPAFKLVADKTLSKKVKRGSKERDIRISQLGLEKADLGDELRFKLLFEPRQRMIVVLPEDSAISTAEDLLAALQGEPVVPAPKAESAAKQTEKKAPTRGKLKALRAPTVNVKEIAASKA